ncbi:diaminopimelate epimerase [Paucibacter oligotrophus]|uniref:Diaminopimelate epimerase n=1 Tax=Roseateles oligotrophus TaxID=1769250 RepID=A0A840LK09_9BURK|nr:diaminopimelate epimerase [Roseateles oligotrophus]MBB4845627.1 diaminopimelate epimerase [Roseateles oligotrophus]
MQLSFTKMQGAGNDFVVIDATRQALTLSPAQLRVLGDRRFGVGCDQILVIARSSTPGVDFRYRIFNGSTGAEVEHCGNGSRCFVRYVVDKGLTDKHSVRVETVNAVLELHLREDGRVTVDMGAPVFELARVPFDAQGLSPRELNGFALWPLAGADCEVAVLSMGNPHAVQIVDGDVDLAPVLQRGPLVEAHARFPRKVNAGFMQILSRGEVRLRVFERDAGETLACGTGACAAVVAGIRLGLLDESVEVHARGGDLKIEWAGLSQGLQAAVLMTGPAQTVFEGEITL